METPSRWEPGMFGTGRRREGIASSRLAVVRRDAGRWGRNPRLSAPDNADNIKIKGVPFRARAGATRSWVCASTCPLPLHPAETVTVSPAYARNLRRPIGCFRFQSCRTTPNPNPQEEAAKARDWLYYSTTTGLRLHPTGMSAWGPRWPPRWVIKLCCYSGTLRQVAIFNLSVIETLELQRCPVRSDMRITSDNRTCRYRFELKTAPNRVYNRTSEDIRQLTAIGSNRATRDRLCM